MSYPERCLNSVFYMLCKLWVKSVSSVSDLRLLWGKTSFNPLSNTEVKNACIISELYFYLLCLPGWVNDFPGVKVGSKCNRHWNDYWDYRGGNLVNPGRFYHPTIIYPSQWNSGTRIIEFCYTNKSIEILLNSHLHGKSHVTWAPRPRYHQRTKKCKFWGGWRCYTMPSR